MLHLRHRRTQILVLFYDSAGSTYKTLKLYDGHAHDLLNDIDKEVVIADMKRWIGDRLPKT